VLTDVDVDHVISDPPYSARTHDGQRHGRRNERCGGRWVSARGLDYGSIDADGVEELITHWHAHAAGWLAWFTDSELAPAFRLAAESADRTTFAPLACVQRGMNVRLAGDGPSNWTTWLCVSRPRSLRAWGTLRGAYVGNPFDPGQTCATATRRSSVVGSKPLWLMRAIVRDYSRPGDLVCDPCAGGATTLLAAVMEGRRAIGAECDPATFDLAVKRLRRGYTPDLFTAAAPAAVATQTAMFSDGGPDGD